MDVVSNHDNVNFNHEQIWGASRTANRARKDQAKPTIYMFNHYWEMRRERSVPCTVTENREKTQSRLARPLDSYKERCGGGAILASRTPPRSHRPLFLGQRYDQ